MNEQLKSAMRDVLLQCYGLDIQDAKCYFSTQNYAFLFRDGLFMIRVSATPKKTRREILSELMWLDDLKQYKQTVCEPNPSLNGRILEEFEIDGQIYRASMFRTARGESRSTTGMTPMFFICVGDLLGAIHRVSTDERELGIRFERARLCDAFAERKKRVADKVPPQIMKRIEEIEARVGALSQELGVYGLCHGDFHMNNFLVEENNVWVFDFDSCTYAHYLYDVASFLQAAVLRGYGAGREMRGALDELLHYFKIGYALNKPCDEHFWDELPLFLSYRSAQTYLCLCEIDQVGIAADTDRIKQFFAYIISQDDVIDAMQRAMGGGGALI